MSNEQENNPCCEGVSGTCSGGKQTPEEFLDAAIVETKQLRRDIDSILQRVRELPQNRETALAITKAQETVMWLGMNLKALGEANPYPNSRDTSNTIVDKTADGMKM